MALTLGMLLGGGMFIAAAWLGEKSALWIPGVVLVCAAAANFLS